MPESETQARPAVDLNGIRARQYGRHSEHGPQPGQLVVSAVAFLFARKDIDDLLEYLAQKEADLARVTAERDSLIERRHEVQLAADARYAEAMRELRDWNHWKEIRQQANELLKEPGIVYQSAHVQAVVTDLMAERDRAREERDAMAGVVEAARGVVNCVEIDEPEPWDRTDEHINGGGCLVELRDSVARLDAAQQEPA